VKTLRFVAYEKGLAMLGHLRFVTPELKLNIVTIVDCYYKRTTALRLLKQKTIVPQLLM